MNSGWYCTPTNHGWFGTSTTIVQAPVTINATTGATADDIGKAAAAHIGDAARSMKAAKGK